MIGNQEIDFVERERGPEDGGAKKEREDIKRIKMRDVSGPVPHDDACIMYLKCLLLHF